MPSRRNFLATLLAAGAAPRLSWADAGSPSFLACAREPGGDFALFGLSASGDDTFRIPLPARGHAGAGHPTRPIAVALARRPGTYALVIDCVTGAVTHRLSPPEGRHFNGHGAFVADGAVLLTSEQLADTSAGRIGIWAADDGYRRMGEVETGGIGPHDMILMPDGTTLAVANGGIATDPADRTKLNIATMRPNLAYLTIGSGVDETVELSPDLAQNSIRHLALRADGLVAFAMQWEGPPDAAPPLLGLHRRGAAPTLASAPEAEGRAMQGYAGSVAFDGKGDEVAISSPKGGRLQRFGADDGQFIGSVQRTDVCGLATLASGLLVTDGLGGLLKLERGAIAPLGLRDRAWDNHVVAL